MKDEWVLVTGGAIGLGAEIARVLASKGLSVAIHYRTHEKEALAVAEECRRFGVKAECIQGEFSDAASVGLFLHECSRRFGAIGHLVNNASQYLVQSALFTSSREWEEIFQTNFFAPLELIQGLLPGIKEYQGGILNIGVAGLGAMKADVYSTAYTLSKQCLWALTKSLAKELAPFGVSVNLLSPGYLENSLDQPKQLSIIPAGRLGTLKEAASAAAFLLDRKNKYITGQNIEVAGGVRL